MQTEIEVKFLNVHHDTIREKLQKAGAKLITPMRLMRRVTIDTEDMRHKNAYIRIRDEGNKITMTYKQFDELSIDGAKEIETEVSDFQTTIDLLNVAGLPHNSFQESKREEWQLNGVEIVLDEWPWLNPYIEIEGHSKESIQKTAELLGFDWSEAVFGDVMVAYRVEYPHLNKMETIGNIPVVKFGEELPDLLKNDYE